MTPRTPHLPVCRNLALIGGRGAGKSSVATRIAQTHQDFTLLSLDILVRDDCGAATIAEIVEQHGWREFREREFSALERATTFETGALIDCGGGIVVDLDDEGREQFSQRKVDLLRNHCVVVYLKHDSDAFRANPADDGNRPSLSDAESFSEIMARRTPWYEAAAHCVVERHRLSEGEITQTVLDAFQSRGGFGEPTNSVRGSG